ncbi:1-(5-phosphoribosyl)-5-[(5-phosphoribosylamino)methylideneamino] imidazole-4-carboxamide isomerase, chloroplastic [Morella rubra]|uniref:1-(5-phosphoribosyl)-5-[(5-phosphoribosylamino)methylideneamino]imidazole-4-carboxamideisomerase n=1 Tax=Morella rubra TaxID=262757 RepID=A0A6A1WE16_9ROSI|nr:1-(5-phosphoribosyl)-5-[(5-phosphoribosylamino)methylideneamino] imidazole-4-carboxamide isomerase, chloroplastic [Morella rubra]
MFQNLRTTSTVDLSSLQLFGSFFYVASRRRIITAIPYTFPSFSRLSIRCAVRFRPCIDIHKGKVKQIVGSTLRDLKEEGPTLVTNFESDKSAAEFAYFYKEDGLTGGHVIMLGADPLSKSAAIEALRTYPGGLQVGGGINSDNSLSYIDEGASHVIVTSYVFNNGQMDLERLKDLVRVVGKQRLVLDLSCRRKEDKYAIVTDRWQKFTDVYLDENILELLASYADEFLVHGVDVEGKKLGIDEELVALLGKHSPIPVTYAGGVTVMADLDRIKVAGTGRVDVTIKKLDEIDYLKKSRAVPFGFALLFHVTQLRSLRAAAVFLCNAYLLLADTTAEAVKYVFPKRFESRTIEEALMAVPDLETVNFKVLSRTDLYEIREVQPYFVAETTMPGKTGFDFNGASRSFNVLAEYLFGKNTTKEKMEMTTPVFTRKAQSEGEKMEMTTPVITKRLQDQENWQMSFVMPSKYGANLPLPKDPSVRIKEVPKKIVAVLAFSGFVTDEEVKQRESKLREALKNDRQFQIKEGASGEIAQYNPPFTLPFQRRNEIALEVERK